LLVYTINTVKDLACEEVVDFVVLFQFLRRFRVKEKTE